MFACGKQEVHCAHRIYIKLYRRNRRRPVMRRLSSGVDYELRFSVLIRSDTVCRSRMSMSK